MSISNLLIFSTNNFSKNVPFSFSCYKFDVFMFSNVFHGFLRTALLINLKIYFFSFALISMYGFDKIFLIEFNDSMHFVKY